MSEATSSRAREVRELDGFAQADPISREALRLRHHTNQPSATPKPLMTRRATRHGVSASSIPKTPAPAPNVARTRGTTQHEEAAMAPIPVAMPTKARVLFAAPDAGVEVPAGRAAANDPCRAIGAFLMRQMYLAPRSHYGLKRNIHVDARADNRKIGGCSWRAFGDRPLLRAYRPH